MFTYIVPMSCLQVRLLSLETLSALVADSCRTTSDYRRGVSPSEDVSFAVHGELHLQVSLSPAFHGFVRETMPSYGDTPLAIRPL